MSVGHMEMPEPPDLTALYQAQADQLKEAYVKSQSAFKVIEQRDQAIAELTTAYQTELMTVFTIAQGVVNPPTALAAIPPVLAATNAAMIQAPAADAKTKAMIEATFAPIGK